MNRRTFLGWVGVGWVASSLPVAIAACSNLTKTESPSSPLPSSPPPPPQPLTSDGFKTIGSISQLDHDGFIFDKQFSTSGVIVVRDPADSTRLFAVNPICTHRGCVVAWNQDEKVFECPCHSAEFSADGKVAKGPAKEPLSIYEAKADGDSVVIKDQSPASSQENSTSQSENKSTKHNKDEHDHKKKHEKKE